MNVDLEPTKTTSIREYAVGKLRDAEDSELVSRACDGEELAFEVLMRRYSPMVIGFLVAKLRANRDTEDLTQEIFLSAFRNLGNLKNPGRFGPWLMRIARNRLIDFLRASSRHSRLVKPDADIHGDGVIEKAADPSLSPADKASASQTRHIVVEEISKLRERYRVVLFMRLLGEESTPQIALRLGLNPDTVRARVFRGMRKLRKALKKRGLTASMDGAAMGRRIDK